LIQGEEVYLRKFTVVLALAIIVVLVASPVHAARHSVGAFGGISIPLGMEDVKSSSLFGLKARFGLMPNIGIEPNFTVSNFGEGEADIYGEVQKRDGGDITSFGVDLVLGGTDGSMGLSLYGIGGLGSAKWSREGLDDISKLAYYIGMGLEYGIMPMMSLDVKAKTMILPNEGGTYKTLGVSAGLNLYFGMGGGL